MCNSVFVLVLLSVCDDDVCVNLVVFVSGGGLNMCVIYDVCE